MTDHGLLKRILLIYRECARRLQSGADLAPAPLFHTAQMVHDYIEGFHEGIEEGYVFPRLLRAGRLRGHRPHPAHPARPGPQTDHLHHSSVDHDGDGRHARLTGLRHRCQPSPPGGDHHHVRHHV
ncbi:hypothetical protein [Rhodococcus opacus]|uniref:hypothetical protein n=1 Tax=Rhodococcus opacus TaxID=37919 RepID=UPI0034D298C9